jgi:hypothetical protein
MTGLLKFYLPQAGSVSAIVVIAVLFIRNDILSVFIFKNFYIKVINVFNVINKYVIY